MSDSPVASSYGEVVKDIWKLLKNVITLGGEFRKDVFKKEIEPVMADYEASHRDFQEFFTLYRQICSEIIFAIGSKPNDASETFASALKRVETLHAIKDRNKPSRRAMFETVNRRLGKEELILRERTLTKAEREIMFQFYTFVRDAFYAELQYHHMLGYFLYALQHTIEQYRAHDLDDLNVNINEELDRLTQYEKERDDAWAEISAAYTELRRKLT